MRLNQILKRTSEKGQSIVIIALVFVGLLAFVGLTVDVGVLFISYGNLRRAVDNAALASATRMRDNYEIEDLQYSASELLRLNNVNITKDEVNVETCENAPADVALSCGSEDKRKLVRVTATVPVEFSFLPVIGFYSTNITASSIAEAASMDVVLVIDNSESMAQDPATGAYIDPATCNYDTGLDDDDHPEIPYNASYPNIPGECHPFEEVKAAAAYTFGNWILNHTDPDEEEDRVAVVVFSSGFIPPDQEPFYYPSTDSTTAPSPLTGEARIPIKGTGILCPAMAADGSCPDPWMTSYEDLYGLITNMQVYSPPDCLGYPDVSTVIGSCEYWDWSDEDGDGTAETYKFFSNACPLGQAANPNYIASNMFATQPTAGDSSTCQTTNIGGGLKAAASVFATEMRKDALWLVVLLTDGAANTTNVDEESDGDIIAGGALKSGMSYLDSLPLGFCPVEDRGDLKLVNNYGCRDLNLDEDDVHPNTSTSYNADDYARDMADLVSCAGKDEAAGCSSAGQGAILYAIGLGNTVVNIPSGYSLPPGDTFLRYASAVGDDGDPSSSGCTAAFDASAYGDAYNCGNYYFTRYGSGLADVFDAIAARVYTRITR